MTARSHPGAMVALLGVLVTAGCSSPADTRLPAWAGGLPPDAPAPSVTPAAFPEVHDIPPPRKTKLITADEQAKLEAELGAIRNRMNVQADTLQMEPPAGR